MECDYDNPFECPEFNPDEDGYCRTCGYDLNMLDSEE